MDRSSSCTHIAQAAPRPPPCASRSRPPPPSVRPRCPVLSPYAEFHVPLPAHAPSALVRTLSKNPEDDPSPRSSSRSHKAPERFDPLESPRAAQELDAPPE